MKIIAIAENIILKDKEEKINKTFKCRSKTYPGIEHITK
jgi:hypothetical protein